MQFVFVPFAHEHHKKHESNHQVAHEHHEEQESNHQKKSCQVCQFVENQSQSCPTSNQSILEVVRYFEPNIHPNSCDEFYCSPFSNQESARAPPTSNSNN